MSTVAVPKSTPISCHILNTLVSPKGRVLSAVPVMMRGCTFSFAAKHEVKVD